MADNDSMERELFGPWLGQISKDVREGIRFACDALNAYLRACRFQTWP